MQKRYCGRQQKRDNSGRAFELGLISTAESLVESILSDAHFHVNPYGCRD